MPYKVELIYYEQQILMFEHEWGSKMSAGTCPLCFQISVYDKHAKLNLVSHMQKITYSVIAQISVSFNC